MIADAPAHGRDVSGGAGDDYPDGSPDGLKIQDLMKEFKDKEIDFNMIKLSNCCDAMIKVMQEYHDELEVKDMTDQMPQPRVRMAAARRAGPGGPRVMARRAAPARAAMGSLGAMLGTAASSGLSEGVESLEAEEMGAASEFKSVAEVDAAYASYAAETVGKSCKMRRAKRKGM